MSNPDGKGDTPQLTALSTLSTANSFEDSTPTASATTIVSFNPTDNDEKEWKDFCSSVNVSPPERINKAFSQVKGDANRILRASCLRRPSDESHYTWEDLEDLQQAGMAFIINEGILDCFTPGPHRNRWITHCVLGVDEVDGSGKITIHGKTMWRDLLQFVRKRGDLVNLTDNWTTNSAAEKYRQFQSNHKDLWGEDGERKVESCTMFSLNPGIDPVLRFQAPSSMVCAFVVSSLMIHYRQVIDRLVGAPDSVANASGASKWPSVAAATRHNQGSKPTCWKQLTKLKSPWLPSTSQARRNGELPCASSPAYPAVAVLTNDNAIETKAGTFTLNIGRYMRHNLTAKQKYETIFEGKGFIFEDVMGGLLRLSNVNVPSGGFLGTIEIDKDEDETPEDFYKALKKKLHHGALCARIRLYDGYEEKTMCVKEPHMNFINDYHFVTIIGVCRTHKDRHGGVMFLAQDSFVGQPFKYISLELLRAMQSGGVLFYIRHNKNIKMPNESVFDIKPADIVTAGGLQLKRSEFPPCTDGPISQEEQKELKEKGELWDALLKPCYLPEWARKYESNDESALNNEAAVVHADTVEGGHEGVVHADTVDEVEHEASKAADAVEGEESIEVQYEE